MKSCIAFGLLCLFICSCSTSKLYSHPKKQVSPEEVLSLEQTTEILTVISADNTEGRKTQTPGFDKAADYTINYLRQADWIPLLEQYKVPYPFGDTLAYNVVAINHTYDPDQATYILSAHLDHLGIKHAEEEDTVWNGANDDASGVTAVLQIANALKLDQSIKQNIILAVFSGEEDGLLGSTALAKQMSKVNITPNVQFNFEMIGAKLPEKSNTVYITGFDLSNMSSVLNKEVDRQLVVKLRQAKKYDLFSRSDNYPFYQQFNIPAHTISTFDMQNYAYYHDIDDEIENLDLQNMNEIIQSMYQAIHGVLLHREEISLDKKN